MEAVGLTISIASLATLFQTAIDCFLYIQLGKDFSIDFQTICLQLDNVQLRLSRWGEALGLGAQIYESASLEASLPVQDLKHAEALLGHIVNLFHQAEGVSDKFKGERSDTDLVEIQDIFTARTLPLHQRMRDICRRRQGNTGRTKKAKWALYESEHLKNLVNDLQKLVSDLIDLFPATASAQDRLCDQEAADMRDDDALPILKDIAARQDRPLEEAITRLYSQNAAISSNTWNNSDNTKVLNQIAGNQTLYGGQSFSL